MMNITPSERLFDIFESLLEVNSPPGKEEKIAQLVKKLLNPVPLIEKTSITKDGKPHNNLLFKLPASEQTNRPTLLLSAHLDTVEPTEGLVVKVMDDAYHTSGNTILGGDDKSGIAIIIETLLTLCEKSLPHPALEILFTEKEEVGLLGSKRLSPDVFTSQQGIILDADGVAGLITYQAPFQRNFKAHIKGIPAHAGSEPEKGKSAILGASKIIQSIPFGRIDDETSLNIGKIAGGKATNIVAEDVFIDGEIRSISKDKLELLNTYIEKQLTSLQEEDYQVQYDTNLTYHGYSNDLSTPFHKHLKNTALQCGIEPVFKKSGGGSDANVLRGFLPNLECVVLSTGMQKVHTHQEFIRKKDLFSTAQWLLSFITNDVSQT